MQLSNILVWSFQRRAQVANRLLLAAEVNAPLEQRTRISSLALALCANRHGSWLLLRCFGLQQRMDVPPCVKSDSLQLAIVSDQWT